MRKLYVVTGSKNDFKTLVSTLRLDWINIHAYDYNENNINKVGKLLNEDRIYSQYHKHNKLINTIINLIPHIYFYNNLLSWIHRWSGRKERVFILVNDSIIFNKVKREFKRPNYVTLLLTTTVNTEKKKFDFVLTTSSTILFKRQIKSFGKKRLASFNIINSKRIRT